ncbi:hypothetical protein [Bradyrhizobium sp. G127]|uniref:hypothetical protein n=1 Tax=Bradyrhizobium sp. G127 TaxID=2904800 RepID=UPI001F22A554|nr:hypothetical protein [Bradyrhizobium sp. G127]MCF2523290.1 hypothetical protein [Bradyrhizobium sp. G127]
MITFEHFSSKYLSSKDSDRRILRSPKMRVQLQQRRKSDGMGDGIEESRQRKHSLFQYFERAIDERVGVTDTNGGKSVVSAVVLAFAQCRFRSSFIPIVGPLDFCLAGGEPRATGAG